MEYNYNRYREDLTQGITRVDVLEQPIYFKRNFFADEKNVKVFEDKVSRMYLAKDLNRDTRALLKSFYHTYQSQRNNVRQYGCIYNVVSYDELAYLELANISTYSKKYNYIIDLGDCLDIILAFMCGETLPRVQQGIQSACDKYKIPYRTLSRAWLTCEKGLLDAIPIELMYEISHSVKNMCIKIMHSRASIVNQTQFHGLNLIEIPAVSFLQTVLTSQMLIDMQYILASVLYQYRACKANNADCMVISKGLHSIVIGSDNPNKEFKFKIHMPRHMPSVEVVPVRCERFGYLEWLLRGQSHCIHIH